MASIYEVIVCLKRTYHPFNVNTIIQNLNCQHLDAKYCGSLIFSSLLFIGFEVFLFLFVLAICFFVILFYALRSHKIECMNMA